MQLRRDYKIDSIFGIPPFSRQADMVEAEMGLPALAGLGRVGGGSFYELRSKGPSLEVRSQCDTSLADWAE